MSITHARYLGYYSTGNVYWAPLWFWHQTVPSLHQVHLKKDPCMSKDTSHEAWKHFRENPADKVSNSYMINHPFIFCLWDISENSNYLLRLHQWEGGGGNIPMLLSMTQSATEYVWQLCTESARSDKSKTLRNGCDYIFQFHANKLQSDIFKHLLKAGQIISHGNITLCTHSKWDITKAFSIKNVERRAEKINGMKFIEALCILIHDYFCLYH